MLNLFISDAFAQAGGPAANQGAMQFLPIILIFVIFYFLMIRPQKKRIDEETAMINALAKGEEIYMKSGMIGTVVGITEKIITLEVNDGVKIKVLKSQIGGLTSKLFETKEK